jgi:hypothetical protein
MEANTGSQHGPRDCMTAVVDLTANIDYVLSLGNASVRAELQDIFGLPNVTDVRDFVNVLISGVFCFILQLRPNIADRSMMMMLFFLDPVSRNNQGLFITRSLTDSN